MADEKMERILEHEAECSTCKAANRHVNDFCERGRLYFFDWANGREPIGAEIVQLPRDQYDRLVAEMQRRERQGERN